MAAGVVVSDSWARKSRGVPDSPPESLTLELRNIALLTVYFRECETDR